jgi:aldehyde:ferredoxin oxidoreductase
MIGMGVACLEDELEFNRRAGFSEADDQLPSFFREALPPHNVTWEFTAQELQGAKV